MTFSYRLDAFHLPSGFKLPQLELYDGTGDPINHLQRELAAKPYKGTFPQRGMVKCNQQASTYEPFDNYPLRVFVAEAFAQLKEFTRDRGHEKPQGSGNSPPHYPPRRQKHSPPRHNPYRRPRSPYRPRTDKQATVRVENSLVAGHVTTIAGGIHGEDDSRNSRKKYARREVTIGKGQTSTTFTAQFTVVDILDSLYNGMIGRNILTATKAIVFPVHLKLKFPMVGGIGEISGNQKRARVATRNALAYAIRHPYPQSTQA
ncbi:hypothetical protein LIER_12208 [Lithospermum erythrorhizon]|uniref:Uncharacterized protein n=1 Tax=Lithospermum erythrorhizon TaxID=34254 RepID=A0AAV3PQY2_LITER